ncbi:MAG: RecQ family ATP-dependent DNA helicase, partial [Flavipsychrobacter sp.]
MPSAEEILKQYWGYDRFRPLQKDIIDYVLSGTDTLALLPTGGGKSLCYQVPALMMEGMCLVISPLIALMQDQVQYLKELEIAAACIHSGMHYLEVKQILSNAMNDAYKLLYVSPERLQTDLFKQFLPAFNLNLLAIDEAHCISQWGHDFRPDYTRITTVREEFPNIPILALTATATEHVQNDIALQLQMRTPVLVVQSFER